MMLGWMLTNLPRATDATPRRPMSHSAVTPPQTDPTSLFEAFRGNHATELLTVAVTHLRVFAALACGPLTADELRAMIGIEERPYLVLTTALKAMGLLREDSEGKVGLTDLAIEHLTPGAEFDVSGYIGLAAESPGVLEMVERLQTNTPAGATEDGPGAAFIFREGIESAMYGKTKSQSVVSSRPASRYFHRFR